MGMTRGVVALSLVWACSVWLAPRASAQVSYKTKVDTIVGEVVVTTTGGVNSTLEFESGKTMKLIFAPTQGLVNDPTGKGGPVNVARTWIYARPEVLAESVGFHFTDHFDNAPNVVPGYFYGHGIVIDTQPVPPTKEQPRPGYWRHVQLINEIEVSQAGPEVDDDSVDEAKPSPELPLALPVLQNVVNVQGTDKYYSGYIDLPGARAAYGGPVSAASFPKTVDAVFKTWVVRLDGPDNDPGKPVEKPDQTLVSQPLVGGCWGWDYLLTMDVPPGPTAVNVTHSVKRSARVSGSPLVFTGTVRPVSGQEPTGDLLHYRTHVRQHFDIPITDIAGKGGQGSPSRKQYLRVTEKEWR